MTALSQAFARIFTRPAQPAGDRANADLVHERMLELEDEQPSPLLLNLATGFPSALLCVLAAGALAGALAGRQVAQPLHTIGVLRTAPVPVVPAAAAGAAPAALVARAAPHHAGPAPVVTALATRQARLEAWELQALTQQPGPALPPVGDGRPR
jgi:hypothetical protein